MESQPDVRTRGVSAFHKVSDLSKMVKQERPQQLSLQNIIQLSRGGSLIKTKIGYIQIGMPPETIKDSLLLGIEVPQHFVISSNKFDRQYCINTCEFEFPAYFNLFLKKRKAVFICEKSDEEGVRRVFRETLLGPESYEGFEEEFDESMDPKAIPNIVKETEYFKGELSVDALITFICFDQNGEANIGEGVSIIKEKEKGELIVKQDGSIIAQVSDQIKFDLDESLKNYSPLKHLNHKALFKMNEVNMDLIKQGYFVNDYKPTSFKIPNFGVTILGASHGFDPHGSTSGMIFWINGRGIAVDPPPFSIEKLRMLGVASNVIDYVIISHCHGDHDAGSLQIILDHSKVEVITTHTIMNSYLRKYSAITGMTIDTLKKFFVFRPVTIGSPLLINGASFKFHYSFHSIPTIGFSVHFGGKSIYYSGDTFYDPSKFDELIEKGVMTKERVASMTEGRFDHAVILHEAGIPPIHTPMSVFKDLSEDVKKRLYLYHVAAKDIPKEFGLKGASAGTENTIVVDIENTERLEIYRKLDLISSVEILKNLPPRKVRDVVDSCYKETFKAGEIIIKEGEKGSKFYIIAEGVAKVFTADKSFERYFEVGDHFGEAAFIGEVRTASVQAVTDVTLYTLKKSDFFFIFGRDVQTKENDLSLKFQDLREKRSTSRVGLAIEKNKILHALGRGPRTKLELLLTERIVKEGEVIWTGGSQPKFAMLVQKGEFELEDEESEEKMEELTAGAFVGDFPEIIAGTTGKTKVTSLTDSRIYTIEAKDLLQFFEENPKLLVAFSSVKVVE